MDTFAFSLVLLSLILLAMFGVLQIFSLVAARASGWRRLAEKFPATRGPKGNVLAIPRAQIGSVVYKNGLSSYLSEEGLYLQPWVLDRLMHRPLLIPWRSTSEVQLVEPSRYLVQALSGGQAFAAILVRLGLKEITRGLHEHPRLCNAVMQIDCDGEPIEIQLMMDSSRIEPYLPADGSN